MNVHNTLGNASETARLGSGGSGRRRYFRRAVAAFSTVVVVSLGAGGCAGTMPAVPGMAAALEKAVALNDEAPFAVGIIPNRAPPVRIGDELGFMLSASETGYGHLYLINASGGVLVLVENLPVVGGAQTMFPAPGSTFTLRASPPAGVERVVFLMTRQPFKGFGGGASGPVQIPVRAQDFIGNLNAVTGQLPEQGWVLAETRVEIVP